MWPIGCRLRDVCVVHWPVDHDPWSGARSDVEVRTAEMLASEGLAVVSAVPRFRYGPGPRFGLRS